MVNEQLVKQLNQIVQKAGQVILRVYAQDNPGIVTKEDATPVTQADLQANAVIEQELRRLKPDWPILSEESDHPPYQQRRQWDYYWLVDPLDGTREFINRNGQFSVNIALMAGQYPLFGIVHSPVTDISYWGGADLGAFRQTGADLPESIATRALPAWGEVIVLGSRSYVSEASDQLVEQLRQRYPGLHYERVGSALKGCRIAEGSADIYPRLGLTSEWDTAAVQAVVEGAGGLVLDREGVRFKYNFKEDMQNGYFMILGDPRVEWQCFWNRDILPEQTESRVEDEKEEPHKKE